MSDKIADERRIAALKRERMGYVARDLPERVAGVDAEITKLGGEPPADASRTPPKGRTAAPQSNAGA